MTVEYGKKGIEQGQWLDLEEAAAIAEKIGMTDILIDWEVAPDCLVKMYARVGDLHVACTAGDTFDGDHAPDAVGWDIWDDATSNPIDEVDGQGIEDDAEGAMAAIVAFLIMGGYATIDSGRIRERRAWRHERGWVEVQVCDCGHPVNEHQTGEGAWTGFCWTEDSCKCESPVVDGGKV